MEHNSQYRQLPWQEREGVWVETDQGVGIQNFKPGRVTVVVDGEEEERESPRIAWVDLCYVDGTTLVSIPLHRCTNVRQARISSIPSTMIEHLADVQLLALGYSAD